MTVHGADSANERPGRRRRGQAARVRDDLLGALPNAGIALSVTATLFWWLYGMAVRGSSNTVSVMPFMNDPDAYSAYWLSQAFGWAALLWAWAALLLGLLLAGRAPQWIMRRRRALEVQHRQISLTVIALTLAHALVLLFDAHDTTLAEVLVPGAYSHAPGRFAVGLGIVALYLMLPLTLSYYVRHRIGHRVWRHLHRLVIVVYALGIWHTVLWGTNVWFTGWPRTLVWAAQIPLALLFLHRLMTPSRPSDRMPTGAPDLRTRAGWWHLARIALRVMVAAIVIALIFLTVRDGGRPRS